MKKKEIERRLNEPSNYEHLLGFYLMFFVFIVRPFTFLSIKNMKKHRNWVQVKQAHTIWENRFMLYSRSWPSKVRV